MIKLEINGKIDAVKSRINVYNALGKFCPAMNASQRSLIVSNLIDEQKSVVLLIVKDENTKNVIYSTSQKRFDEFKSFCENEGIKLETSEEEL